MTLLGFDSVHPESIPADAQVIFPYADGDFKWSQHEIDAFPHAKRRFITVLGDPDHADIIDVERFDATPSMCPSFIHARKNLYNSVATIYCNRDTLPRIQEYCRGLTYNVWLATLDDSIPTVIHGGGHLVAVQFRNDPVHDYDETLVLDVTWPLDPHGHVHSAVDEVLTPNAELPMMDGDPIPAAANSAPLAVTVPASVPAVDPTVTDSGASVPLAGTDSGNDTADPAAIASPVIVHTYTVIHRTHSTDQPDAWHEESTSYMSGQELRDYVGTDEVKT
jgi:hypothetical protein